MISMILKVNLGVGGMGFMFCDYKFDEFALFDFCFCQGTHPILGILVFNVESYVVVYMSKAIQ